MHKFISLHFTLLRILQRWIGILFHRLLAAWLAFERFFVPLLLLQMCDSMRHSSPILSTTNSTYFIYTHALFFWCAHLSSSYGFVIKPKQNQTIFTVQWIYCFCLALTYEFYFRLQSFSKQLLSFYAEIFHFAYFSCLCWCCCCCCCSSVFFHCQIVNMQQ